MDFEHDQQWKECQVSDQKLDPASETARSDGRKADENRETLKEKAKEGLKDLDGKLPKDEI